MMPDWYLVVCTINIAHNGDIDGEGNKDDIMIKYVVVVVVVVIVVVVVVVEVLLLAQIIEQWRR